MLSKVLRNVALTVIAFLLWSCGGETPPAVTVTKDPESVAKQVVADFMSIPASDVSLVSITAEEFNDSSLDCPEPGMSYLQVLTPGHRALVEADGRRFDVRISGTQGRICRRRNAKTPETAAEPRAEGSELIELARQDLARHLATTGPNIQVLEIHPFSGGTALEGCAPECDESSAQCGYLIGLSYDGRRYDYHADDGKVAACPPILTM